MTDAERTELTAGAITAASSITAETEAAGPLNALKRFHASLLASNGGYALAVEIVQAIQQHQPSLLAKQAAYSLLYAVPSILIMLVSLAAIVDKNTGAGVSDPLREFIAEQAPAELQPLLETLVQRALVETNENTAVIAALIAFGVAVWGAAGGVGALIYAINSVYGIKDRRPFIKSAAINIGYMVLGGLLAIAAIILLAFGRILLDLLPGIAAGGGFLAGLLSSSTIWALALLAAALLLLYWIGLDAPKSVRWLLPGTILATVAIGLIFRLLDLILSYSNPGAAYGVVGSVLILLWTLFVISAIVVVGAIVNAVLGRRYDRTLITGLQRRPVELPPGKRIAVAVYR